VPGRPRAGDEPRRARRSANHRGRWPPGMGGDVPRGARGLARAATRLAGDAEALAAELRAANGRREDEVWGAEIVPTLRRWAGSAQAGALSARTRPSRDISAWGRRGPCRGGLRAHGRAPPRDPYHCSGRRASRRAMSRRESPARSSRHWSTSDALREAIVVARDFTPFVTLIEGRTSTSLIYDRVRALRAWLTGRPDPSWRGHFTCQTRPHHVFLTAPRKTTPDQN
jgi:hypothetical protein